jgi:4-hydroxy-2-oxoglutarate aldolase
LTRFLDNLRVVRAKLQGIIPPIPTPFDDERGEIDPRALSANVRRWMSTKLAGVLVLGSNGEAALLDEAENDVAVGTAREHVPADRVLLVGTGRESTRATVTATKRAAALGADAVLVRAPGFFKGQMTAEALVAHFTAVAEASPVPVLLYNLPNVVGFSLTLPVVATLAAHPNIVGMKETSTDLERLMQFAGVRPDFRVLCGWGQVAYPALASGASGAILAVSNVVPDVCVELYDAVRAGRYDAARALQQRLIPLAQLVTAVYGIAGLKMALEIVGYHGGPVRAPLLPAPPRARPEIASAIQSVSSSALAGTRTD